MAGYKDYRSVSEFPSRVQKLDREELESQYFDLRREYKSLTISRGQLVRRQTEAKEKLHTLHVNLQQTSSILEQVQRERQQLQEALRYNTDKKLQLQERGSALAPSAGSPALYAKRECRDES
ncbi:MAG: hypothetical protein J7642_11365 [Cyanobacteria bacterium SBC]|nr:hypothetical protein [Cyanobacteria bacterium SBC]